MSEARAVGGSAGVADVVGQSEIVGGAAALEARRDRLGMGTVVLFLLAALVASSVIEAVLYRRGLAEATLGGELLGLGALSLLFARWRSGALARVFPVHLPARRQWLGLLLLLPGTAAVQALVVRGLIRFWPGTGAFLAALDAAMGSTVRWPLLGALLVLGVVPGVCEELAFRGVAFHGLARGGRQLRAIVGSALVFGLFHLDPAHMVIAASIGLVIGWVRARAGTLLPGMVLHVLNNALAVLMARHLIDDDATWGPARIAVFLLLGSAGVVALVRAPGAEPEQALPPAPIAAAALQA